MDLTPHSAYSPRSPPHHYPTLQPQPPYEYPSPAQSDSRYRSRDSLGDLGAYSCTIMSRATVVEDHVSLTQTQSSTATNGWDTASGTTPGTSTSTPNIPSVEYDPFAPFHPSLSSAFTHGIYPTRSAEVAVLPTSPVPSGNTSQRSSFSSAPTSEIFTQAGSIQSYTPRIKMEDHAEYNPSNESMMMSSPPLGHEHLATSENPYPGSLDATYYQDQTPMGWSKIEYSSNNDLPSISSLTIPQYDRRSESQDRASNESHDQRRASSSTIARTRQPRKLTAKEDANFQCNVKGCGKFFGRSYNFKAHMETHDATREYPFPCTASDCSKKFVRKTDLQRHHQSVHMKQRTHRCDYCSRYFARKDTLRRHMEDGCSKRFDIETINFRPQGYSNNDQNSMGIPSRPLDGQSRQPSYGSHFPSSAIASSHGPQDGSLTSGAGSYSNRSEYSAGEVNHDQGWSR